jgi:hypothetical protein
MALDNFAPTRIRALRECPQGQQAGDVFEVTADVADILVKVGCAERLPDDYVEPKLERGSYRRRDLRAER